MKLHTYTQTKYKKKLRHNVKQINIRCHGCYLVSVMSGNNAILSGSAI